MLIHSITNLNIMNQDHPRSMFQGPMTPLPSRKTKLGTFCRPSGRHFQYSTMDNPLTPWLRITVTLLHSDMAHKPVEGQSAVLGTVWSWFDASGLRRVVQDTTTCKFELVGYDRMRDGEKMRRIIQIWPMAALEDVVGQCHLEQG